MWQVVALAPVAGAPRPRAYATASGKAGVFMPAGRWDAMRGVLRANANGSRPVGWDDKHAMSVDITLLIKPPQRFKSIDHAEYCTKKPDIDNTAKLILDALNCVCWVDDVQVIRLSVSRCWGSPCQETDRTVVVVRYA